MKILLIFLLLCSYIAIGQSPLSNYFEQKSDINIKGNKNIIKVIQGKVVKVYNMTNKQQAQMFLNYLKTIPTINKEINQILRYDKKTLELVSAIYERTNAAGIFNPDKFLQKLEEYIRENERLKIEIENLRKQTLEDVDFAKVLEEANKKLEDYDNEGYQHILDDYKIQEKNKLQQEQKKIANVSYLQAKNNQSNFKYHSSLEQIDEALKYYKDNPEYLFLKAQILFQLVKYDESLEILLEVATVFKDDTLKSEYYNFTGMVHEAKGNYDKFLEYNYKALDIQEKVFGKDYPTAGSSYNNIGMAYYNKGDYDNAINYLRKALNVFIQVDTELPNTATAYNNIGLVYDAQGDLDTALKYYNKALTIQQKILGEKHPDIAIYYINIGAVYYHQSNFNQALHYYNKALIIMSEILGKEHPSTATCYNNMGSVYNRKGNYDSALTFYNKALIIFEKVLGKEDIKTANSYNNIGSVYDSKGDLDTALKYYNKALTIQEKVSGKENPVTATSYNNIGFNYYERRNYAIAIEYYFKALSIREKVYGPQNDNTRQIYRHLGLAFIAQGEKEKGLDYLKKSNSK